MKRNATQSDPITVRAEQLKAQGVDHVTAFMQAAREHDEKQKRDQVVDLTTPAQRQRLQEIYTQYRRMGWVHLDALNAAARALLAEQCGRGGAR